MSAALALIEDAHPGGDRVVALRGEVDYGTAPALREWLRRATDGSTLSLTVVLDQLDFLGADGLHVLCDEALRMAAQRARLTVVCSDAHFLQLFRICGLDGVLHVVPEPPVVTSSAWSLGDDVRTRRLGGWLSRYEA
jgi:anti-anti-sigma factor